MLTTSCWGDLLIWKSLEILFNRPVHKSYCQSLTVKQSRAIFRCRASPACPSGMSTNTVRTALNCTAGKSKHNKVLQMRCMYKIVSIYDHLNLCVQYLWAFQCLVLDLVVCTRSTAQGGGGSFKNIKPIGEVGCCDSRMAERIHWWTERLLRSPLFLSFSLSDYLPTYLPTDLSIYLCIYPSIYLFIYLSISLALALSLSLARSLFHLITYLSLDLSVCLSACLSVCLHAWKRS